MLKEQLEIRRLIKNLPEMVNSNKVAFKKIIGSKLIEQGINIVKDERVNPLLFYDIAVPYIVNHEEMAMNAFNKAGMPAVKKYCVDIVKLWNSQTNSIKT